MSDGDGAAAEVDGGGRAATIYDVAKLAGVSHITVSRFLHGYEGIRPETRERVSAAVAALNYRPNMSARSLVTSRSHQIAALVHEIAGTGPGKIIQGASHEAREAGYSLDIVTLDPLDDAVIANAMNHLSMQHIGGILATAPTVPVYSALQRLEAPQPLVIVTARAFDGSESTPQGPYAVMQYLLDLGHRQIVHLAGPRDWIATSEREHAYRFSMQRAGLEPVEPLHGDWSPRSGYELAEQVVLRHPSTTAIFCANDRMALGVLKRLRVLGIAVPTEMSVVGYDDQAESEFLEPSLTTCRQDLDSIGRSAARRLISLIEGGEAPLEEAAAPVLMIRDSAAPPRSTV